MKTNAIISVIMMVTVFACNAPEKTDATTASDLPMPYTATYSSQFNQDVADKDVQTALNGYKAWETGDIAALRTMFADSVTFRGWDGSAYDGPSNTMLDGWAALRDSIASIKIEVAAWAKLHSTDKNNDFVNVWYKTIDQFKSGRIDSAEYHSFSIFEDGKVIYYAQYKRDLR